MSHREKLAAGMFSARPGEKFSHLCPLADEQF
jgi:hypothetical protein